MIKNLLYIVFASFIFFMGFVIEDFIALYETRPNQYPPYGKEVVDVNGLKFMRDIKDETNENEEEPSEDFIALEKKYPSGCNSTSRLSEEYSCSNLFDLFRSWINQTYQRKFSLDSFKRAFLVWGPCSSYKYRCLYN